MFIYNIGHAYVCYVTLIFKNVLMQTHVYLDEVVVENYFLKR